MTRNCGPSGEIRYRICIILYPKETWTHIITCPVSAYAVAYHFRLIQRRQPLCPEFQLFRISGPPTSRYRYEFFKPLPNRRR